MKKCTICNIPCNAWEGYSECTNHVCSFCARLVAVQLGNSFGPGLYRSGNSYSIKDTTTDLVVKDLKSKYQDGFFPEIANKRITFSKLGKYWQEHSINVAKQNLAEEILEEVDEIAYPFGGYVRDEISGDHFNDLDLYFPVFDKNQKRTLSSPNLDNLKKVKKFRVQELHDNSQQSQHSQHSYNSSGSKKITLEKRKFLVHDTVTNTSIYVDCVQSKLNDIKLDHGYHKPDIDINKVAKSGGKIFSPVEGVCVESLISDIKQKRFSVNNTEIKENRIQKLIDKGYSNIIEAVISDIETQYKKEIIGKAESVKEKIKAKTEISSLKPGDRVTLVINDGTTTTNANATFVKKRATGESGVFALDKPYNSGDYNSNFWEGANKDDAVKLGINIGESTLWDVALDQDEETIVTKFEKEKDKKMSKDESSGFDGFKSLVAADAKKGMVRTGATTGINGLKAGLRKVLSAQGMDGPKAEAVMEFFESDLGTAGLRCMLGYGLNYVPIKNIQENEYAKQLSEELRVSGISQGMDVGMSLATQFVLPALMEAFQNSPIAAELGMETSTDVKARIAPAAPSTPTAKEEAEEEAEEVVAKAPAKMSR